METRDLLDLTLIFLGVFLGALTSRSSTRIRDVVFFLLAFGVVVAPFFGVNFLNCTWYQGTSNGLEFSLVDVLALGLLVSLLLPRRGPPTWFWPASLGFLLIFLVYCGVSVAASEPKLFGLLELSKMVRGLLVFLVAALFIRGRTELGILVVALGCATCLEGVLAFKQYYWDGSPLGPGGLDHPNSHAMYLCMVGPVFVAAATSDLHRYVRWFAGFCAVVAVNSILMTTTSAGLVVFALIIMGTVLTSLSREISAKQAVLVSAFCLVVGGALYLSWHGLQVRYTEIPPAGQLAGQQTQRPENPFRLAETIVKEQPLGVGLNNWSYWVSKTYGARLNLNYQDYDHVEAEAAAASPQLHAPPAKNLLALTAGELGWPGLLLFVLLWLRWLQMGACFLRDRYADCTERIGLGLFFAIGGAFLLSFTESAFWQTPIYFTFHILLGTLAGLYHLEPEPHREEDTVFLSARGVTQNPWQLAK